MATQDVHTDRRTRLGTALVAFVLTLLAYGAVAAPVNGQSLWTGTAHGPSLQIEMLRPDFSGAELGFVGATGAGFVSARVPLGTRFTAVADVPFARAAWEVGIEEGSSSLIGNPYVGAEWRAGERITAELGVRLPTGELDENKEPVVDDLGAMLVGMAGELERIEAFAPRTLGLYAAASYQAPISGPLSFRVRGGTSLLGGDGTPEDLYVAYTGQLVYAVGGADVAAGLTGRANATTDDEDADRAFHQAIVAGGYRLGRLRPGVQLRFPLDGEAREITGFTAGVSLGYAF